jgi:16S rRNA (guanine(1405)-N(7))-methyltransferase
MPPRSGGVNAAAQGKQQELVAVIKSKRGLETLDDAFVQQKVEKIFNANNKLKQKFEQSKDFAQFSRSKEYEELLKRVRKELRAIYGVFQDATLTGEKNREELLRRLRLTKDGTEKEEILTELLRAHTSTKERLPYYDEIYTEICNRTHPISVIDLGCGMNPLAYHYFVKHGCKPTVVASDISRKDMEFLEECFRTLKIPGKAVPLDLTKDYERLRELKADVTLMLKLLDSLEEAHRHISYKLFENIRTEWVVASFPTKSLGGKKNIARAGRTWFERLLKRKGLSWETFAVENELFYVIRRKE